MGQQAVGHSAVEVLVMFVVPVKPGFEDPDLELFDLEASDPGVSVLEDSVQVALDLEYPGSSCLVLLDSDSEGPDLGGLAPGFLALEDFVLGVLVLACSVLEALGFEAPGSVNLVLVLSVFECSEVACLDSVVAGPACPVILVSVILDQVAVDPGSAAAAAVSGTEVVAMAEVLLCLEEGDS